MSFGLVKKSDEPVQAPEMPELKQVSPEDFPRSIYVAGASSEIERARAVMQKLREMGFNVTSTWVENITDVGDANPMGASREQRLIWSVVDLHEVSQAAILFFLLPSPGVSTSGAFVELGYASAMKAFVDMMRAAGQHVPDVADRWLLCSGIERSIFTALCDHYETDEAAIAALAEYIS